MAEAWTTDELIDDIRAQGSLSEDDPAYSDAACISAANRELKRLFVPSVRKVRAEYYVTHVDLTLVADQSLYRIPHRAATNSVRQVFWLDSSGRVQAELTPVSLADHVDYTNRPGRPAKYTIKDDHLVLLPAPSSALGTLRVLYERRPSSLILVSSAQAITSVVEISSGVFIIETDGTESAFHGDVGDIVRAQPPFSLAMRDVTLAQPAPPFASLLQATASSWDTDPAVGDFVCAAGESCIPQIPVELHPLLALASAVKLLRPIDADGSRELQAELDLSLPQVLASLAPRQQGKQIKLRSTSSYLRRGMPGRGSSGFADWE